VIRHGKKFVRLAIGSILIVLGIALSIPGIPGPGILIMILGLSILSTDFEFARRLMTRLRGWTARALEHGRSRKVKQPTAPNGSRD
jgi:hypothetical protein